MGKKYCLLQLFFREMHVLEGINYLAIRVIYIIAGVLKVRDFVKNDIQNISKISRLYVP